MLIRNYGHLWERKYIHWGWSGVRGNLIGYLDGNQNRFVDFREQIGIYVLFDSNLKPVYVGQAGNGNKKLFDRLKQHETDHLWNRWEHFSWFGFRRANRDGSLSAHDDSSKIFRAKGTQLLNEIEGALITALEPRLNKQGARWKDVELYYQEIDDAVEDITNEDLSAKLEELQRQIQAIHKRLQAKR